MELRATLLLLKLKSLENVFENEAKNQQGKRMSEYVVSHKVLFGSDHETTLFVTTSIF